MSGCRGHLRFGVSPLGMPPPSQQAIITTGAGAGAARCGSSTAHGVGQCVSAGLNELGLGGDLPCAMGDACMEGDAAPLGSSVGGSGMGGAAQMMWAYCGTCASHAIVQ